jgi:predicted branched-subunit amino acid permease
MRLGAVMAMPTFPGAFAFGLAFGAAAAAKGLTLGEAVAMSVFIFAGMSQMVALEAWPLHWSWSAVATVTLLAAVVNSRMILMAAALHPWISQRSNGFNLAQLSLLTDINYLIGERHRAAGGRDVGVLVGAGLTTWLGWIAWTIPGHILGGLLADPKRYALDLVMPVYFTCLLVPLWRGRSAAAPWAVAGIVAFAVSKLFGGQMFILAGALAGMGYAALQPDDAGSGTAGHAGAKDSGAKDSGTKAAGAKDA